MLPESCRFAMLEISMDRFSHPSTSLWNHQNEEIYVYTCRYNIQYILQHWCFVLSWWLQSNQLIFLSQRRLSQESSSSKKRPTMAWWEANHYYSPVGKPNPPGKHPKKLSSHLFSSWLHNDTQPWDRRIVQLSRVTKLFCFSNYNSYYVMKWLKPMLLEKIVAFEKEKE